MRLIGALDRAGQFFRALGARRSPPDPAPAAALLSPALFALFRRMPPEDRRHGLAVLALIRRRGEPPPALAAAALLHDLGKAEAGIGLRHRVARVLLRRSARPLWRWLAGWPTGWHRPFWVMANHPERGAIWAETAGAPPDTVALIRHHERHAPADWAGTPLAEMHATLAWADAQD